MTKLVRLYETATCHDNPRKAVKLHRDYNKVVNTVKGLHDNHAISKFIEDWILKHESGFADIIIEPDARYVYCEHAAEMVSQILDDADIRHILQVGIVREQSHAWVKLGNVIIDPTKSQFAGTVAFSEYMDAVDGEGGWQMAR